MFDLPPMNVLPYECISYFTFIEDCESPKACTVLLRGASKDILMEGTLSFIAFLPSGFPDSLFAVCPQISSFLS